MAGKANRKHKRNINRPSAKLYLAEGRAIKNAARKKQKHLRKHPHDFQTNHVKIVVDYKSKVVSK